MFVKLHSQLLDSSLWCEPPDVTKLWICLMLMADPDGQVNASAPGIASRANLPLPRVKVLLEKFAKPDPDSRNPQHQGRRIERIDGGYKILNFVYFRYLGSKEWQREQTRLRVEKWRSQRNASVTQRNATKNEERRTKNEEEEEDLCSLDNVNDKIDKSKRIRETNVLISASNSFDLPIVSKRSKEPTRIGEVLERVIPPRESRIDETLSRCAKVTGDRGFLVDGWRRTIGIVLCHPGAAEQLRQILDDLPKDSNARSAAARGKKQIMNPKSYLSSQIKRLEKIALNQGS